MKKMSFFFAFLFLISLIPASAQETNQKYDDKDNLFYATLEDAQNHNPLPDLYMRTDWNQYHEFDIFYPNGEMKRNVKCKSKEWPSEYFTNRGMLLRVIDGKAYICLSMGKINFYQDYHDGKRYMQEGGLNTGLKKWDQKYYESLLQEHNLLMQYQMEKPKREFRDTVSGYGNKMMSWQLKFMMLLNEKM
ncbi:hypothetical protein [Flavobacterium silvaticum]|uniref:GLPGLI family protein n=1 Tax=Flavobacterium silvaticum TaxID=1852020 RepID=A0A972FP67_9FLAO|nr:hypothetical protein [Flavobacterium silvaticum]NMH28855.1 hypothetical protein [Flavobacterium silvaticum]